MCFQSKSQHERKFIICIFYASTLMFSCRFHHTECFNMSARQVSLNLEILWLVPLHHSASIHHRKLVPQCVELIFIGIAAIVIFLYFVFKIFHLAYFYFELISNGISSQFKPLLSFAKKRVILLTVWKRILFCIILKQNESIVFQHHKKHLFSLVLSFCWLYSPDFYIAHHILAIF